MKKGQRLRTGFTFKWQEKDITGKKINREFYAEKMATVDRKRQEMIQAGHKVGDIVQCIF